MQKLKLTVANGPSKGRGIDAFPGKPVKVGRNRRADLAVMDPAMSRTHFELYWDGTIWILRDLESHNGTFLGDRRINSDSVRDGDSILAGYTVFAVVLD